MQHSGDIGIISNALNTTRIEVKAAGERTAQTFDQLKRQPKANTELLVGSAVNTQQNGKVSS